MIQISAALFGAGLICFGLSRTLLLSMLLMVVVGFGMVPQWAAAQQAEISRLEAEAQYARTELTRYEALRTTDDVTVSEVEARRNAVQVSQFAVEAARHTRRCGPASDRWRP